MEILNLLKSRYQVGEEGIFYSDNNGYWLNSNKEENKILLESLQHYPAKEVLVKYRAWLENVIYSPKREAGLELLQLSGDEFCIDYGCTWGTLTIPLAKRVKFVLGIGQTFDSLRFLDARMKEERLSNIALLCHDIRKMPVLPDNVRADIAVVNGVLEWVPEEGPIELKNYFERYNAKKYSDHPGYQQEFFLKQICQNLQSHGKLYLAIENRFDFKTFLGVRDPHVDIPFVSFLPRKIADLVSWAKSGRPYVNWLYSFNGIDSLLKRVGFSKVDLYMCFPDYRFPERIIPYANPLDNDPVLMISTRNAIGKRIFKKVLGKSLQMVAYKLFKANFFSPSIIAIGYK